MKSENRFHPVFVCRVELFSVLVMTMFDYLTPKLRWNSLSPPKKTWKCQNWIANICVHKYICLWAEKQEQNQKDICLSSWSCRVLGENENCLSKWKDSGLKEVWSRFIASREQIGKWRSVPGIILHSNEALVDESPFGTIFLNFVKFFCRR